MDLQKNDLLNSYELDEILALPKEKMKEALINFFIKELSIEDRYDEGYEEGYEEGISEGDERSDIAYETGYDEGYADAVEDGKDK
jgi:flagellar biosynthesis/type III secretory pathway protein FliH